MNVTLITDSSKEDTGNQYIFVDRKWMSQLRYILGTGFEHLFVEDKSLSKNVNNGIGFIIKSQSLETVLKERLNKLIEHVYEQRGNHEGKSFLQILDQKEIIEIDLTQEKPLAILRKFGSKKIREIHFDMFFCADSYNDNISNKFLGNF
ncbi:unnamed protein product [Meloidogyne enterolobii]|uniref:Uncharacterized protein n=1 Tax=Meloidogyne enterolobii TaxID=390850 RepID=A0ACB0ZM60_MELEN